MLIIRQRDNVSDESSINDWKIQVPRGKIKLNGNNTNITMI